MICRDASRVPPALISIERAKRQPARLSSAAIERRPAWDYRCHDCGSVQWSPRFPIAPASARWLTFDGHAARSIAVLIKEERQMSPFSAQLLSDDGPAP